MLIDFYQVGAMKMWGWYILKLEAARNARLSIFRETGEMPEGAV